MVHPNSAPIFFNLSALIGGNGRASSYTNSNTHGGPKSTNKSVKDVQILDSSIRIEKGIHHSFCDFIKSQNFTLFVPLF